MPENVPPPLLSTPRSPGRTALVVVLSLCLGFFLADAFVSLADDSLVAMFNSHRLTGIRMVVGTFAVLLALAVYVLMALTAAVPKRWFLPIALSFPLAPILVLPFFIYWFASMPWIAWGTSVAQVVLGLWILFGLQGGFRIRWPLMPPERLGVPGFSWRNLGWFVAGNLLVLLPGIVIFVFISGAVGVRHLSSGFMALRPSGITVQVRKYVRDGKTVEVFPMSHIADAAFYQSISQTFPTNSIILMEGVSDEKHLLTNGISYHRAAKALGLSEQREVFVPKNGKRVRADVDVSVFSKDTLSLLNVVMLFHVKGLNANTLQALDEYSTAPDLTDKLYDDLVRKRNQRLLEELNAQLPQADYIVVPWGVAHMPQLERDLQKENFKMIDARDYTVIQFFRH